ncbi:Pex32p PWA37_000029 [Arxiozyma heterogenica]|uniref:TECPR1-like DysF domain-containing protein n=1 Tax=Arxiozyma heterogenica TaxID=278026 RepID=A0AAN8A7Y4_9SACH|nr:hypothetical protein RI543_004366 [Kazachstania heterogenica]
MLGNSDNVYRVKFANNKTKVQKVALIVNTPFSVTAALYKLYPLLIIWDNVLNHLLWITNDTPLHILYLIICCLSINYLLSEKLDCVNFEAFLASLIGFITTSFNWYSFTYYINSVLIQINDSEEAPTLEDIYFVLNRITDKNLIIKNNLLKIIGTTNTITDNSINYKYFCIKKFIICILLLTPFQFFTFYFRFIDSKKYIVWLFVAVYLYNSSWLEVTGYLLWRIVWVRKLYCGFWNTNSKLQCITMKDFILLLSAYLKDVINIDLNELQNNYNQEGAIFDLAKEIRRSIDENSVDNQYNMTQYKIILSENYLNNKYEIIEIIIQQNERKWYPDNWNNNLLSYEKPSLLYYISQNILKVSELKNLEDIETSLPLHWDWLENDWKYGRWIYSDTNWNILGTEDSLNAYTRTRIIKRLVFCQI